MRYLKINKDLYLSQVEVSEKAIEEKINETTNHVWIIDRSGSMYHTLPHLIEDLINRSKKLPIGDYLTLGWFSSEGQHNFILKGFKISDESDYATLESILRKNKMSLNLTCFSEIIASTKQVISDLKVLTPRFAVVFLSDGYPVVSNYNKEITAIFQAIDGIRYDITASLLVGYGNYYNKELMSQMAEAFGGSLTHSSDLEKFSISLNEFIENVKDAQGRIRVLLDKPTNGEIYFSINGTDINVYQYDESINGIMFLPTRKGKNWLFRLSDKLFIPVDGGEEVNLTDSAVDAATSKIDNFVKGVYAASYILSQKCQNDKALSVLGVLGDKYLITKMNNAFTNEEYGKVEELIKNAVVNPNKRFVSGRNTNYLPQDDAFCVLDLLDMLSDSHFYPYHAAFHYKRIGIPSVPKEGYPKFEAHLDVSCRMSDLVWNKNLLNLSLLARIPGYIKLDKNYKKLGFDDNTFDTHVWRNYTLIKDGMLNVTKLPVSITKNVYDKIKVHPDLIASTDGDITILDLSVLPIMNRKIAKSYTSAEVLFGWALNELYYQSDMKVLKYFKEKLSPEKELLTGFEGLSEEQIKYLMDLGITKNGYSPPTEKMDSSDYYMAKSISISIKGFSSLPKIDDVIKKEQSGKKLTASEELIYGSYGDYIILFEEKNINEINGEIAECQTMLKGVRSRIQKAKFAVILGKSWFEEFSSRDDTTMKVGGYEVSLKLGTEKIKY